MKLLFIWVKKYNCFENLGFNLSDKHKFEFDYDKCTIKYHKNESSIDNFFDNSKDGDVPKGRIISLNAVVGNNGSGKTTFLELIFHNLVDGEGGIKSESLFIFEPVTSDKFIVHFYYSPTEEKLKSLYVMTDKNYMGMFDLNKNNGISNGYKDTEILNDNSRVSIDELKNTHFIYMSNTFDNRYYSYTKMGNISDLSTVGLIKSDFEGNRVIYSNDIHYDININFFHSEFSRQIEFITKYKSSNSCIPFELPKEVRVEFQDIQIKIDEIYKQVRDNEAYYVYDVFTYIQSLQKRNDGLEKFKNSMVKGILFMLLNDFINEPKSKEFKERTFNVISDAYQNTRKNYNDVLQYGHKLLGKIMSELSNKGILSNTFVKPYYEFIEWLIKYINQISNFKYFNIYNFFTIPTQEQRNDNIIENVGIKAFFNEYKKTARIADYLNFTWPLSTGENTLITLFSRFFSITKEKDGKYYLDGNKQRNISYSYDKKAFIMIDEADLTFHPEWQQQYLKLLLGFLQDVYVDCDMQIVITTHSPIILSDIPKNNVIFLRKSDSKINVDDAVLHEETFGANISTLFYDSFFMKRGSIGEFAKEKINGVFTELKNIGDDIKINQYFNRKPKYYLKQIIDIIGEPIIKNKLLSMYYKCFPNETENPSTAYIEKIRELQNIIVNNANIDKSDLISLRQQLKKTVEKLDSLNLQGGEESD